MSISGPPEICLFFPSPNSVSYTEFLKPFLSQSQIWKHGSNMAAALQTPRETKEVATLETLSRKIRKKVMHCLQAMICVNECEKFTFSSCVLVLQLQRKARALSKACARLDGSGTGLLSAAELGAVLQLFGVCQSQEELKSVFSTLHTHPSGHLDYRPLLMDKHRTSSHNQQTKHQLSHRSQQVRGLKQMMATLLPREMQNNISNKHINPTGFIHK